MSIYNYKALTAPTPTIPLKMRRLGFNLASVFEVLQKFNIIVPSKEQLEFVNSKITSQFLKDTNILTGLSVYNDPLQTHTPAGKASWGAGACVFN